MRGLLAGILALSAVLVAGTAGADKGKTLTIGVTQFPSTFHPIIDSMLAKSYILGTAIRPVTIYDHEWQLACMVCEKLPTLENGGAVLEKTPDGKDGVAVTYRLDPKATWGDGTPVTGDDIRFIWEVGKHPESGVTGAEVYQRIWKVETPSPKTVVLHIDRVTYNYNAFPVQPLPAHLERARFEENPREYKRRTHYDTDTTNPGLYFGPYRIGRVSSGAFVELVQNEHWHGTQPYFDRIVIRVVANTAALEANLLSGSIDYISGELGLTLDQALSLEKRRGEEFEFLYKAGLIYEHIDLNLDNPILADKRVRQALLLGIDRQAVSERLFKGKQPVAKTNVNPLDWIYAADVPDYSLRSGQSKSPARGIRLEGRPWRHPGQRAGRETATDARYNRRRRVREQVQQVLQHYWKQIGVKIRIQNQPARVFFGQTVRERRFKAMAMFAWISAPESLPRSTLHSTMIPTEANNWAGQNYTGYENPAVDTLLDAIEVDLNRETRAEKWHELQRIYAEDLPALPLYFRANTYVIPRWLKGIRPTGHQAVTTLWAEQWRAE